jgi:HEAT repeat protein
VSKRRKVLIGVICLVMAAAAALLCLSSRDRQPYYGGRSLEEWIETFGRQEAAGEQSEEARRAVLQIGTNALPSLLDWIAYQPAPWRDSIAGILDRLPKPIGNSTLLRSAVSDERRQARCVLAESGFRILQEQAAPAIPELARMLYAAPTLQYRATFVLESLGTNGLSFLIEVLAETNYPGRCFVVDAISLMRYQGTNGRPAVPILIRCIQDKDTRLAIAAINALGCLHLDVPAVVPALTNAFASPYRDVRCWAVRAFGTWYLNEANQAVPALKGVLSDPDYRVRSDASNILARLESAALTNAPAR